MPDIAGQILKGSEDGQKRYEFNDQHDPNQPAQYWFQESEEGLTFFVVFYTQACRWSRCRGCNLPSKSSLEYVDYKAIIQQIDNVFSLPEVVEKKDSIHKLIASNNGSILDEQTFSSTALMYFMAKLNMTCKNLRVLTIETRPEYVDLSELEFLSRALAERETPADLELAIGLEAYDETIRNGHFDKGLDLAVFEAMVAKMAPYDYRLQCYLMQKPVPDMTDTQAKDDIRQAFDYLSRVAKQHQIRIQVYLNPTYVAFGTILEEAFQRGDYEPPLLSDVVHTVKHAQEKNLSVFVGLNDEGLAVPGGSFIREGDEEIIKRLEAFNKTQDYSLLRVKE